MTLNKKYENLIIYQIGPMEDDDYATHEFAKIKNALVDSGIPAEQIINPCEQEEAKLGFSSMDANNELKKLRLAGKDDEVKKKYDAIWAQDCENIRQADILIANIPSGTKYVGTTKEATIAGIIRNTFDRIKPFLDEEQKKIYEEQVRPGLKKIGFPIKPVYIISPAKTRLNGTMYYDLGNGEHFYTINDLIKHLKELYK